MDDSARKSAEETTEDLLGKLAERRAATKPNDVLSFTPTYLESVVSADVRYSMRSPGLPLAQVNASILVDAITRFYGSTLSPVSPGELVKSSGKFYELSQVDLLEQVLKRDTTKLFSFEGGRFQRRSEFIPIRSLNINAYGLYILVESTSDVAEAILRDVVTLIWAATGFEREWEELSNELISVTYGTITRVRLPVSLRSLLSPKLQEIVDEHIVDGEKFAARMHPREQHRDYQPGDQILPVVTPSRISFTIDTIDRQTGTYSNGQLTLWTPDRSDANSNIVQAISTLPFKEHMTLVDLIVKKYT